MAHKYMKSLAQDVLELSFFSLLALAALSLMGGMDTRMLAAACLMFLIPAVASSAIQLVRDVEGQLSEHKKQGLC